MKIKFIIKISGYRYKSLLRIVAQNNEIRHFRIPTAWGLKNKNMCFPEKHPKGLSNVREQQLDYEMSTFFRQEWYDNRLAYGPGQIYFI